MRRETLVVLLVVGVVLVPMWFVGLQGESPSEEVQIDQSVSEIRPLEGFLDAPNKLSPSQVGVVVWMALFLLVGVLTAAHRFMNEAVRPDDPGAATARGEADDSLADGGESLAGDGDSLADGGDSLADGGDSLSDDGGRGALPWFETDDRWVVEYAPASEDLEGIVVMGALSALSVVFAALFTGEYLTLARTQYFGVYAAGMFLSLAMLTVAYYAWFMPHVEVAERRGHRHD